MHTSAHTHTQANTTCTQIHTRIYAHSRRFALLPSNRPKGDNSLNAHEKDFEELMRTYLDPVDAEEELGLDFMRDESDSEEEGEGAGVHACMHACVRVRMFFL